MNAPGPARGFARGEPVRLRGVTKRYGNTWALRGVDLDLHPGEVLGIAGPNGAGKSTLMRILAGEEAADAGEIRHAGTVHGQDVLAGHVAVVHQEPQLFANLSLAENLLVGREGTRWLRPRLGQRDRDLLADLDASPFADSLIADCPLAMQQRTEIGRALAREAGLFLFDEPNSALTAEESTALFSQMHRLAAAGNIVILVTHRFDDLVSHARRVVIVRDGQIAATLEGRDLTEEAIARQLVQGLDASLFTRLSDAPSDAPAKPGPAETLLSLRSWSHAGNAFKGIDFAMARGEVIGLLGVEGSGAREFLRSLAGVETASGTIALDGQHDRAQAAGAVAYVAPSRAESLFHNFSVADNLLARLGAPEIAGATGTLKRRAMRDLVQASIRRFVVKTPSADASIGALSGGNQQKVAIAQAILTRPRLVLLEEPTRGVDIGSKREIYALLGDLASAGAGVLFFSTEVVEVFEAAQRVHVFTEGRLSPALDVARFAHVEDLAAVVTRIEDHLAQEQHA